jgi:hypothetical protein
MAARSTLMRIHNRSDRTFTLKGATLDHGDWTHPNQPPGTLLPNTTVFIESESGGVATGTEGTFRYASDRGWLNQWFRLGDTNFPDDFTVPPGGRFRACREPPITSTSSSSVGTAPSTPPTMGENSTFIGTTLT